MGQGFPGLTCHGGTLLRLHKVRPPEGHRTVWTPLDGTEGPRSEQQWCGERVRPGPRALGWQGLGTTPGGDSGGFLKEEKYGALGTDPASQRESLHEHQGWSVAG